MCSQLKELKSVTNAVSEIKQLAVDISTKMNNITFTEAPQSFADVFRQQLQPMKEDMATLNTSVKERESVVVSAVPHKPTDNSVGRSISIRGVEELPKEATKREHIDHNRKQVEEIFKFLEIPFNESPHSYESPTDWPKNITCHTNY